MNRSRRLADAMPEISNLLASLDLASLPELHMVMVKPHRGEPDLIDAAAMLRPTFVPEIEAIDAVRTWAVALGGVVLLSEENDPDTENPYRKLSAVLRLPSGGLFEVGTTLYQLRPAPGWTPADPGLITA